jgi:hypothetical protein
MRIFVAGIRKLVPRPASWVTIGILVGLMALIFVAIGGSAGQVRSRPGGEQALTVLRFPGAYTSVLSFILGLGGLLAVIYGAAIAGSEWTWGTLKNAVARGEGRARYMVLTFASIAVLTGLGMLVAFVVGVLAAVIGANLAGLGTDGIADSATLSALPEKLLRGWLGVSEEAALGFAIATIARSQLAGIGAGIALYFGESFATLFLPDVVKYLPFNVASAVVASTGNGGGFGGGATAARLEPDMALVMAVIWLVGALIVSSAVTEQADIGG